MGEENCRGEREEEREREECDAVQCARALAQAPPGLDLQYGAVERERNVQNFPHTKITHRPIYAPTS